jgi:hypothetical protein
MAAATGSEAASARRMTAAPGTTIALVADPAGSVVGLMQDGPGGHGPA